MRHNVSQTGTVWRRSSSANVKHRHRGLASALDCHEVCGREGEGGLDDAPHLKRQHFSARASTSISSKCDTSSVVVALKLVS